ncbi:MAG: 50S ribosomal protein L10 [Dehalococcoidia bacterium]
MVRKEKKPELVDWISDRLRRAEIAVVTDYRGLNVAQLSDLRNKLREQGIEYHVVKNTLAKFAADATGKSSVAELLEGPTAIAFGYEDPVKVPKTILDYMKAHDEVSVQIRGGLLGDRALTNAEVLAIAKLPPREELIARTVGLIQSPLYGLMNVLNGNLRGLAAVLQARVQQLEQGG